MKSTTQWRAGQWGEAVVRSWLESHGRFVVPTALIEDGGAPALTQLLERHVLPDLQAFDESGGAWWEVKYKTKPDAYQIARQLRHGIAKRLWLAYCEVERLTGLPGMLAIVEGRDQFLLSAPLSRLAKNVYPHTGSREPFGGEEMVFFARDDFDIIAERGDWPDSPPRPDPPPAQADHPWEPSYQATGTTQPRLDFG